MSEYEDEFSEHSEEKAPDDPLAEHRFTPGTNPLARYRRSARSAKRTHKFKFTFADYAVLFGLTDTAIKRRSAKKRFDSRSLTSVANYWLTLKVIDELSVILSVSKRSLHKSIRQGELDPTSLHSVFGYAFVVLLTRPSKLNLSPEADALLWKRVLNEEDDSLS